ncbi:hypothetical protein [Commensalibacter nepenthis]|uniref:Uncharacterized protein n=1 Tax=Commensalibacter nepenthis TaxID=3043872 RepID=A0ABT6QAB8_9PROT|nr:hypothetical protein [Commensalibacter sp. TBRC 10068]MDI2113856.1 hypothetical protein [Commensalibacter sp. TBRC 10068]
MNPIMKQLQEALSELSETAKRELLVITEQHRKSMNAVEQKHEAELKLVNERLSRLESENQELKSLLKNCLNELE